MSKPKPVPALKALFLSYALKNSFSGEYYVFNVTDSTGSGDICRMDAIHKSRVEWIFDALDNGDSVEVPVTKDIKTGYRIDLNTVDDFNPNKAEESTTPKKRTAVPKVRAQFNIEPWKLDVVERIAKAEGYDNYTDWIRAYIDRVIDASSAGVGA